MEVRGRRWLSAGWARTARAGVAELLRGQKTGRHVGFPRFPSKGRCQESIIFQRPRLVVGRHVMLDRRLGPLRSQERLSKLRRLLDTDLNARVLRSTVQKQGRTWYISFTVERSPKQRRARLPNTAVGVDVGLKRLATLSKGEHAVNTRLARHIADVGWGAILAQLKYKAAWAEDSTLVAAGRFYPSSKTCSGCGSVKAKLDLSDASTNASLVAAAW